MEALLRFERVDRIRMDAMRLLFAPSSGNPCDVVAATLVSASREAPSDRTDWLREQLQRLARECRTHPNLREERFPLLIQSIEPELALELLRSWQDDQPDAWRPQRLRAETELRAGHHAAALEWAERVRRHPRRRARSPGHARASSDDPRGDPALVGTNAERERLEINTANAIYHHGRAGARTI